MGSIALGVLGSQTQTGAITLRLDDSVGRSALAGTEPLSIRTSGALTIGSGTGLTYAGGTTVTAGNGGISLGAGMLGGTYASVSIGDANTQSVTLGTPLSATGNIAIRSRTGVSLSTAVSGASLALGGSGDTGTYIVSVATVGGVAAVAGSVTVNNTGGLVVGNLVGADGSTLSGVTVTGGTTLVANGASSDITLNSAVKSSTTLTGTSVVLAAGRNFFNNVGSTAVSAGSGRWLVYSSTIANDRYGIISGGTASLLTSGQAPIAGVTYSPGVTPAAASGNNYNYYVFSSSQTQAPLLLAGTVSYVGSTTVTATGALVMDAVFSGTISLAGGNLSLAGKNVGTETVLGVSGMTLPANYTTVGATGSVTVTPATLTDTGAAVGNRTYDAATDATITSTGTLTGVYGADVVTLSAAGASAAFLSKTASTAAAATITGLSISGSDAANYVLASPSVTVMATIAQRR
eukprot:XP_015584239.1 uncharacterized protein LOC107262585 [Ricinus communis]